MILKIISILFILISSITLEGQKPIIDEKVDTVKMVSLMFQGDSRRTFIDKKSVGIFGARLGVLFQEKFEIGLGVYSSNLFGILGSNVNKDYQDNKTSPPEVFPAEIGFHYFSLFGEYRLLNSNRIVLTLNSQLGLGWVDIDFDETIIDKERIRENKSLVEHSLKADVLTLDWLRLIGGIGYRYLLSGEPQIKDAFNAPIYIVGFSADFKLLRSKIFKKGKNNQIKNY